ncbi:DUF1289 domain-containing protein [Azospirillum sp.]|uniref:DUF1289 domain-containing protein n=1 Tax=Azospirillum sp. TaxID=34012 RepID=UPI002634758D|nr:DUF1289 domain-containing protein [Azospirillum sp.]
MSVDPDCLGMCAMDGDVCTGCGRTLDQINAALGGDDEESDSQDDGRLDGGQTAGGR